MQINIAALQRERKSLLTLWKDVTGAQKMYILVRIMDIDEQLEKIERQKADPPRLSVVKLKIIE